MASGAQVLEQPGLHVLGPNAPWRGEQRPNLAPADVPPTPQLDARQIVSGRNFTLAAARISAASPSVIQSAAAGMGQPSLRLDDRVSDEPDDRDSDDRDSDEPDEPDDPEDSDEPVEPDAPDFDPLASPDPEPPSDDPFDAPSLLDSPDFDPDDAARAALALPRSFLAQPEPL
jgi:hypothetical protein